MPFVSACVLALCDMRCGGLSEHGFHVGWISEREMVGEMCLFTAHNHRRATVIAGEQGVELVTFERSTFNHLENRARHDVGSCMLLSSINIQAYSVDNWAWDNFHFSK